MMKEGTKRSIFRWIHIIFAIPILGYIYSPFEKLPDYAFKTRFIFVPIMGAFGIVDVERPSGPTICFEGIDPQPWLRAKRCQHAISSLTLE